MSSYVSVEYRRDLAMIADSNNSDRKLPTRLVCRRYGISDRTLARWERNPDLSFPPAMIINHRKYFDETALSAWERKHARSAQIAT